MRIKLSIAGRSAPVPVIDDDEISEAPDTSLAPTPAPEGDDLEDDDRETRLDDEDPAEDGTPAADSEQEQTSAPRTASNRTRTRGRSGKHVRGTRLSDWGTPEPLEDAVSDAGTPRGGTVTRGRGRGGRWRGGFRGRLKANRGGPSHATQAPVDKEGNPLEVENDEVVLPEDPEGETKVDKDGILQDGREYRVRTFKLQGCANRLYMLSTEPARCTGFRDSYLFFAKHPTLFKIVVDEEQKKDLISRDLIPHSYKGRSIGVVTAHSVFREFGCKIVVNGKKITDDYKVAERRAAGDVEGELADPTDAVPVPGRTYNRNQYVAWHGATSKAYSNEHFERLPTAGKAGLPAGKRKHHVTATNWMLEHAVSASRYNSALTYARKFTHDGVYDANTNLMCYPSHTQPTHARWERVSSPPPGKSKKRKLDDMNGVAPKLNGDSHLPNGIETSSPTPTQQPGDNNQTAPESKIFKPLTNVLTRNFLIVDTHFETAPVSSYPPPGHTFEQNAITGTSSGAPQLSELEMDDMELPEECRVALREARTQEMEWTNRWGTEADFGSRGDLRIGIGMGI